MRAFLAKLVPSRPLILPAIISGILVALSFPVLSIDWLVFVALVPLFAALQMVRPDRRDAFRAGFLFGFVCYLTMLWWIIKLIPSADVTIPWLMTPALVLLVLYLSVYPAFFCLVTAALGRYRFLSFVAAAPAVWVLFEVIRARGALAFPWGSLGYALSDTPPLIQLAALGGLPLLSFLVVLVNALLAALFALRSTVWRIVCPVGAGTIVALVWWYGAVDMERLEMGGLTPVRVAVVQPNVDLTVKWKPEFRDSTLRLIERLSYEAAAREAELIVFPETSAPVYIDANAMYRTRLTTTAATLGIPIIIGFLDYRYDGPNGESNIYNSSGVFRADGSLIKYDKNHLLPFGEALPGSRRFRWLRKINFGQANFEPGPARMPMDTGPIHVTPLICFESVFPYLCARGVVAGSRLLVNITNDGWFGNTPGPYQHAQMCILRAVEFRRYLVRSANTGVSMVVAPTGEVIAELGLDQEGMIVAEVTPMDLRTYYSRHGDRPVVIATFVLMLVAWWVGRRHRVSRASS